MKDFDDLVVLDGGCEGDDWNELSDWSERRDLSDFRDGETIDGVTGANEETRGMGRWAGC